MTTPTPYYLTLRALAEANRAALANGTLLADVAQVLSLDQRTEKGGAARVGYRRRLFGKDCHCAVGCALPPDVLDALENRQTCAVRLIRGAVQCESLLLTEELQDAHDAWLQGEGDEDVRANYLHALEAVEAAA